MSIKTKVLLYIDNFFNKSDKKFTLDNVKFLNIGDQIQTIRKQNQIDLYKAQINSLLNKSSDNSKPIVKAVLTNQLKYILVEQANKPLPSLLLNIAAAITEKVTILSSIVGIQPMNGPTGLVYKLQVRNIDELLNDYNTTKQIEVITATVEATSRRLQTNIPIETISGISTMAPHINCESEIIDIITTEVAFEIINEVLHDLVTVANTKHVIHRTDDNEQLHIKHALTAIQLASQQIETVTFRGKGNVIICSPDGANALISWIQSTKTLIFDPINSSNSTTSVGLIHIGNIINVGNIITGDKSIVYKVCTTPCFSNQSIHRYLIGYKGTSETDAGYFYCPFVTNMSSGAVNNSITQLIISLLTRYGKHYDDAANYYRIVDVDIL